jgi:hypothetical protein
MTRLTIAVVSGGTSSDTGATSKSPRFASFTFDVSLFFRITTDLWSYRTPFI